MPGCLERRAERADRRGPAGAADEGVVEDGVIAALIETVHEHRALVAHDLELVRILRALELRILRVRIVVDRDDERGADHVRAAQEEDLDRVPGRHVALPDGLFHVEARRDGLAVERVVARALLHTVHIPDEGRLARCGLIFRREVTVGHVQVDGSALRRERGHGVGHDLADAAEHGVILRNGLVGRERDGAAAREQAHKAGMAGACDRRVLGRDGERVDRAADGNGAVRVGTHDERAGDIHAAEVTPGRAAEVERAGKGVRRQGRGAGINDAAGGRERSGIGAKLQAEVIEHLRDLGAGDAGRGVQAAVIAVDDAGLDQAAHLGDRPAADGRSVPKRLNVGGRTVGHGEGAGDDDHRLLARDAAVRPHRAVTVAVEDVHLRGGAQLRIVPGGGADIGKMRNVLARRAAKDTHEHGGHLGARGVVIRHHVAAGIAEQDTVIAGKIQRRLIPRAGRRRYGRRLGRRRGRRLGRRLRAGFRAGFGIGRGRRLRYGGGGLHGVRLCGDDRHDGQRQHARKHEQQRQKAFAHGFLLPVFLWGVR